MTRSQQKTAHLFVLSGPSGSGKTTLCRELAKKYDWYYSISHTTRKKRAFEKNGVDYFFVSCEEFTRMIQAYEFLEWAVVYENDYGTSQVKVEEALARGQSVVVDVDTQGALSIKKIMPQAVLIFIQPPQIEELKKRLTLRGGDSEEEIQKRMRQAEHEMQFQKQYDFVVVNDDLQKATQALDHIVQKIQKIQKIREGTSP